MPDAKGGVKSSLADQARQITASKSGAGVRGNNDTFGPGEAIAPTPPHDPRVFDFVPGWNRTSQPRSYEPYSFASLRAFANVEMVRLAIETRKDQMCKLGWRIKKREEQKGAASVKDAGIEEITRLFKKPDGKRQFATWFRVLLEDLFAIDAPAIERRRTRTGQLVRLDVIPGDTIKLLVDESGRVPDPPDAAYQQIIRGLPWANLTTNELLYAPRNVRPTHLYGCSPVEQIIVTINIALQRQTAQLAWFTEGNLPAGLATLPQGWDAKTIKEWQDWFDAKLSGNQAERAKLVWAPDGAKYQPFKEAPLKDEFDEWLARIVCFCFSLSPTPFIKQLNRSTAETSNTTSLDEGLEPTMIWSKDAFDDIIANDLGRPDLEWGWDRNREVDPLKQAQINKLNVDAKLFTRNEIRAGMGHGPMEGGDDYESEEANDGAEPGKAKEGE